MVKHIILWKLKDEVIDRKSVCENAKKALENLNGNIDGLVTLKLNINPLESSNADMMLDSTLESVEALEAYQKHPMHVEAANTFVRPFTDIRLCLDFKE